MSFPLCLPTCADQRHLRCLKGTSNLKEDHLESVPLVTINTILVGIGDLTGQV